MKPPLARVPPLFWQRTRAKKILLRPLIEHRFVLALTGALVAMGSFLFFADPIVLPSKKTVPEWLLDIFRSITRLGNGSLPLWPSGILIIVLLALQRLRLGHVAHATLASLAARLTLIFPPWRFRA